MWGSSPSRFSFLVSLKCHLPTTQVEWNTDHFRYDLALVAVYHVLMLPMVTLPTRIDLWLARQMAGFFRLHERLDVAVDSAMRHNILGGLWFGAVLFVCWVQAARKNQREVQLRILTTLGWPICFPSTWRQIPTQTAFPVGLPRFTAPWRRGSFRCIELPAACFGPWCRFASRFLECMLAGTLRRTFS